MEDMDKKTMTAKEIYHYQARITAIAGGLKAMAICQNSEGTDMCPVDVQHLAEEIIKIASDLQDHADRQAPGLHLVA